MGNACGGPPTPEETATTLFIEHWDRFLTLKGKVIGAKALGRTQRWTHVDANEWARCRTEEIRETMQARDLASAYTYKVEGSRKSGRAIIECRVAGIANGHFIFEISYHVLT